MELIGYDPYVTVEQARALGIELLSVPDIMKRADFITVHTPLTPATTNLIGEKELKLAKPGLRIINCARGGIINEEALAKAVEEGRIAGAAIDVFTKEPAVEPERSRELVDQGIRLFAKSSAPGLLTQCETFDIRLASTSHGRPPICAAGPHNCWLKLRLCSPRISGKKRV